MSLQEILAEIESLPPEDFVVLAERVKERASAHPVLAGQVIGHLAGCLDELPHDLSTNPKYLEGFGQ